MVDGDEDGEAGDGNADGEEGEDEAMLEFIGEEGDDHCEAEGAGPGRDGVELSFDGAVAIGGEDRGGEEGVAIGGDYQSEVHESAKEDFVVFEDVADVFEGYLALCCAFALVGLEAGFDVFSLFSG